MLLYITNIWNKYNKYDNNSNNKIILIITKKYRNQRDISERKANYI